MPKWRDSAHTAKLGTNLRRTIRRWRIREETSLNQQFRGKTIANRFRGLRRSERNEARLFLVAMVPLFVPALLGIPKWSDASALGRSIMGMAALWAVVVLGCGGIVLFRILRRYL